MSSVISNVVFVHKIRCDQIEQLAHTLHVNDYGVGYINITTHLGEDSIARNKHYKHGGTRRADQEHQERHCKLDQNQYENHIIGASALYKPRKEDVVDMRHDEAKGQQQPLGGRREIRTQEHLQEEWEEV